MTDENLPEQADESSTGQVIRQVAGLQAEEWPDAKVAAARELLPREVRSSPGTVGAFLARVTNAGLNPFEGHVHVWKDRRGDLVFQIGREAWVQILRRDPAIEGFAIGCLFSNEDFRWKRNGDEIVVQHEGGMKRGNLVGAYCVLHMADEPDHIEMRLFEDYSHLHGKDNWKKYPPDMMTARVTAAAAKAKSSKAAGLVDEAGLKMPESGERVRASAEQAAQEATEDEADRLAAELAEEEGAEMPSTTSGGQEIEAEAREVGEANGEQNAETEGTPSPEPDTIKQTVDASEAEGKASSEIESGSKASSEEPSETTPSTNEPVETKTCPICTEEVAKSSYPGHKGGHTRSGYTLPDGVERIVQHEDGFVAADEYRRAITEPRSSWEEAIAAAEHAVAGTSDADQPDHSEPIEPDAIDQPDAFDDQGDSDQESGADTGDDQSEDDQEGERSWSNLYGECMSFAADHPDGVGFVRQKATELFSDRVGTNDDGIVQISELDLLQLAELRSEVESELSEAEF